MVREIQIRSALTELKLINVFKKRKIKQRLSNEKNYINFIINNSDMKNIIRNHHMAMSVGLVAIVVNGQETLSIDNYDIK